MAQTEAQFRFFAGDDCGLESVHLLKSLSAHHRNPATKLCFTDGRVPLDVAYRVVDECIRKPLSTAAAHHRRLRFSIHFLHSSLDPSGNHFAIAIDKLHKLNLRMHCDQPLKTGVARPPRGEGDAHIQLNNVDAQLPRDGDALIGRSRINVEHNMLIAYHRAKTTRQTRAFIAADDNNADLQFAPRIKTLLRTKSPRSLGGSGSAFRWMARRRRHSTNPIAKTMSASAA